MVDIKTQESVDVVDVSTIGLVNSTPFFQGLATGGNVSQALVVIESGTIFLNLKQFYIFLKINMSYRLW